MKIRHLWLLSLMLPMVLLIPTVRDFMEASMLRHMLGIFPLLVVAGGAFGLGLPRSFFTRLKPWNRFGIPGLLLTAVILAVWMIPLALDRAIESIAVDVFKNVSVFVAGLSLFVSLPRAQLPTQLFFVWNWVMMTVFTGVIYQSLPQRLCSAYLLGDQARTGQSLVAFAVLVGCGWCFYAWRRYEGSIKNIGRIG